MNTDNIDSEGYRANVGIIISNNEGKLFLAGRIGSNSWQFPQGGILESESPTQAMYRELYEEIGLEKKDVKILAQTECWLRYKIPKKYLRRSTPLCIGQKQKWFMLKFLSHDGCIHLDKSKNPEFDRWRWVNFWDPMNEVIYFKKKVYKEALIKLGPYIYPNGIPKKSIEKFD